MVAGEPVVASTESGGAGMGAASRGNDLRESPAVLSRDTTHHMGPQQELCGAAGGITVAGCYRHRAFRGGIF